MCNRLLNHRFLLCLGVLITAMLIAYCIDMWLGSAIAVLLILQLSIVIIALQQDQSILAYSAAVIEAVGFNYLFTTPRYSLQMFHLDDIVNTVVFLIVAFTTSKLAISYRKQQRALEQTQVRNKILLSVSHDLRTPLAGIIGNLTTYKEYQSQLAEVEKDELLNSAINQSNRLHRYIENLLQATKLHHHALKLRKSSESLIHILNAVTGRFGQSGERFSIQVTTDMAMVSVDRYLLEQALYNILDNALKYSPKNSPVVITLSQQNHNVQVDFFNQGSPITNNQAKKLFELFYSDQKQYSADSGTGLGLSVAKGIICAHDGDISSVNVNNGCLIRVTLASVNMED